MSLLGSWFMAWALSGPVLGSISFPLFVFAALHLLDELPGLFSVDLVCGSMCGGKVLDEVLL